MALDRILHLNETFLEQPKQTELKAMTKRPTSGTSDSSRHNKGIVTLYIHVLRNTVSEFMQLHASDNYSPVYTTWTRKIQGHSY